MENILRLAVQKSGRLREDSAKLLNDCGIDYEIGRVSLRSRATNFPLEIIFLRDDDIPAYVADRVVDAGIVGSNTVAERSLEENNSEPLGFSKCRLAIAVPKGLTYKSLKDLGGLKIATSHPVLLTKFLKEQNISAGVYELSGSVEVAPSIGLAEAVCDLVSTGSTLVSNGLKEVETVFESEAVLTFGKNLEEQKMRILDQLLFRIKAVRRARHTKYIMLNAPNEAIPNIINLIPGAKSPTITPLAISGWSSLHSVVEEDDFWEVIEKLKTAGAQGILVIPIEKMVM